ncbi:ATP-binding protein [Bacteroides sp. 519]|uniref:ATP-binding protein n=1 Tax=Bacteroides sp. 519 TaxID=2302937 RepID=UPI0013D8D9EF|nr:ATP-binding protein [Bacteroides sp. 519]NDV59084.1 ATP-binding protein [Bacteroides sp. 519]
MKQQIIKQEEARQFEPTAKILAANGIAQSLSFTSERKYLNVVTANSEPLYLEVPNKHRIDSPSVPFWLKISQVGKPLEDSAEKCFTAIQKILASCFIPTKTQLIFIVHGENGIYEMYLGLRSFSKEEINATFVENLSNFIEGIWPGMKCSHRKGTLEPIQRKIRESYDYIDALTGIPSMESQYKTVYPATIDTLLSGMRNKNFTYMVIADPISENDIDGILYQCRDFNGQAESLKTFNFSENQSSSMSKTLSLSKSITDGTNESTSKKNIWGTLGAGLMLASILFPPAGAITTAVAVLDGANRIMGGNLLSEFTPTKTKGTSHSETTQEGKTDAFSEQQGKSISSNIVNKQIESVSEHLFYHSKRYELGKALGCWSVGVYLLSDYKNELQSASMQLKSIVSGQESTFEPIRIHHIEDVVDKIIPQTLAQMDYPLIKIKSSNGTYFQNPFGKHFNDLRTVLTTKELSYFINFPLRSVPGISVIDSSPEFSLSQVEYSTESIHIGSLLYGGSETSMKYQIPISSLAKHTLLSGINGSGKTNTVQAILNGLTKDFPFLVIEPAKTEYVDWALEYNKKHPQTPIDIYMPGCKIFKSKAHPNGYTFKKKLKLNPFEIVWLSKEQEPNVLAHIDRLKSTFAAAFPMYDILPILMEDLIYTVYQNTTSNWLTATPEYKKTLAPTLNSMSISVDKVISNRQYEERIERNMKACLNTRIDSLKRGWKGEMLNTTHSTDWKELFEKRCIINLSYVGDDVDKAFLMALILQFLYEYKSACVELGQIDYNDNACKHLTVIEEAHRVMAKCENQELPQYKSAMMFSNMLSEIRAYGEGMFLVDQVPTRLIPDAIKNTNLKITHRLVAEDDSKAISESMGLNEEQRKVIPKLMTGQCLVAGSLSTDTYWIKVDKVK